MKLNFDEVQKYHRAEVYMKIILANMRNCVERNKMQYRKKKFKILHTIRCKWLHRHRVWRTCLGSTIAEIAKRLVSRVTVTAYINQQYHTNDKNSFNLIRTGLLPAKNPEVIVF